MVPVKFSTYLFFVPPLRPLKWNEPRRRAGCWTWRGAWLPASTTICQLCAKPQPQSLQESGLLDLEACVVGYLASRGAVLRLVAALDDMERLVAQVSIT